MHSHWELRRSGDAPRYPEDREAYYEFIPSPIEEESPRKPLRSSSRVRNSSKRRAPKKHQRHTSLWTYSFNFAKVLLLLKLLSIIGHFWTVRVDWKEPWPRIITEAKHHLCQLPGTSFFLNCNLHSGDISSSAIKAIDFLIPSAVQPVSDDFDAIVNAVDAIAMFQGDAILEFKNRPQKPRAFVHKLATDIRVELLRVMNERDSWLKQIYGDSKGIIQSYEFRARFSSSWKTRNGAITNIIQSWYEPLETMSSHLDRLSFLCNRLYMYTEGLIEMQDNPSTSWWKRSGSKSKSPRMLQNNKALLDKLRQISLLLKDANTSLRKSYTFSRAAERHVRAHKPEESSPWTHWNIYTNNGMASFDRQVVTGFAEAGNMAMAAKSGKSLLADVKVKFVEVMEHFLVDEGKTSEKK